MVNQIEHWTNEVQQLEQALEQEMDLPTEVSHWERLALAKAKVAELEARSEFTDEDTEDLRSQLEDAELRREEMLPQLKAAQEDRTRRPAHLRKLEREFKELSQNQASLRSEIETRAFQEANDVLSRHRAEVVAAREVRADDAETLAGLKEWRKEKATEELAETFDERLESHTEVVHERLLADADAKVGARLFNPGGGKPTEPTEEAEESDDG